MDVDDVAEQTLQSLRNIGTVLGHASMEWSQVARLNWLVLSDVLDAFWRDAAPS